MKPILLKIDDSIFLETEKILTRIKMPRVRYINDAIAFYNHYQRRQILEDKLKNESFLVQKDSLNILQKFEKIDYVD